MARRLTRIEADLSSEDADVVAKALDRLASLHHAEAVELLFQTSCDDTFSAKTLAEDAFAKSVSANPKIALWHTSSELRKLAIKQLSHAKFAEAVPELAKVLHSKMSLDIRCLSAEALGTIGLISCVPILVEARQDQTPEIRAAALHGLQNIMQLAGETAVVGFLEDYDWTLRQDAKEHLESTGWTPKTNRERVLWGIILGRFDEAVAYGKESVDALVDATLHVNDAEVRRWSAVALTRLSSDVAKRTLARALRSKDAKERDAAANALAIIGEPIDIEGLSETETGATSTPSTIRESFFAAAARMLMLIGQP
ncbi:MAG: HEAT repeat domain-containing protein [Planctomycetota bacterium]|nr:HEAT repeat domain-containing protein [Planctomycetota bacterium]MDA1162997.1 HEAT repeat domain-containing protein [Planctomycetota bacterium]